MKLGHIEINVRQYADSRWGFDDYSLGNRKKVRLKTKGKADRRATDLAVVLANGRDDLLSIDRIELAAFRQWKSATAPATTLSIGEINSPSQESSKKVPNAPGFPSILQSAEDERRQNLNEKGT